MAPVVQRMVAVTYVADIDASRTFYELFGFRLRVSGKAATSAWASLHAGEHSILLAWTSPPLKIPRLPLLFYFFFEDLDAVVGAVRAAGVEVTLTGHPPHALGGEAKVRDPDGNTVLFGQREPLASQPPAADEDPSARFSLLREAAALVQARGGTTVLCEAPGPGGEPCGRKSEVKLADTTGGAAWVCVPHADEILVMVPGAFVASTEERGLAAFLARHRGQPKPVPGRGSPGSAG
jgi:predicted enzyme related to lactoylglutathione lyase